MTSPLTKLAGAATAAASPEMAKLKKAGQQFEAVFLRQMISSMRTASMGDGILDSDASKQFRDMSDAKVADAMAGKGVLGIADMLVKQWGARVAHGATAAVGAAGDAAKTAAGAAAATLTGDAATTTTTSGAGA